MSSLSDDAVYFESLIPEVLVGGRYRLIERLGRGGFGEVWRAHDERVHDDVAIKVISDTHAARGGWYEAYLMRHIEIPGVVSLIDEGRDLTHRVAFFVMSLAGGLPFPGEETASLCWMRLVPRVIKLARTMHHLHAQAIVHLDLKPGNVLVDVSDERVTVLDFGLSRQLLDVKHSPGIAGTPGYLSPEQIRRQPTSSRTDIYALGVMCYEALCGELPRSGETIRQHMRALLTKKVTPLVARGVDVPAELDALIMSMLDVEPGNRPASMLAVAEALQALSPAFAPAAEILPDSHKGVRMLSAGFSDELAELVAHRPWAFRVTALHHELDTQALMAFLEQEFPAWRVERVPGGKAPFESIRALLGRGGDEACGREALEEVYREAIHALDEEQCLVVEQGLVDRWSWALLEGMTSRQVRLCKGMEVPLARFEVEALGELFSGIELWLNLRSRAARSLYAQTGGELFKVWRTLQEWHRMDLVNELSQEGRYVIDEARCLRIERGERGAWEGTRDVYAQVLDDEVCLEVLTWIMISKGLATLEHCVHHMGRPRWEVEAWVDELEALGMITVSRMSGLIWTEALYSPLDVWSSEQLRLNHLAIADALDAGEPRRINHLVLGGEKSRALQESRAIIEGCESQGQIVDAIRLLREVGLLARHVGDEATLDWVLTFWASRAMLSEGLDHVDQFLLDAERFDIRPEILELTTLLRAQIRGSDGAFDLDYLMSHMSEEMHDPWLELCRMQMFYRACQGDVSRCEDFLKERAPWFAAQEAAIALVHEGWSARLLSMRGDFAASAAIHEEVASKRRAIGRVFEMLGSVHSACEMWLNALAYDRAAACYEQYREELARAQGGFALRLRYIGRRIRHVLEDPELEPHPEIEGIVRHVGRSHFEAVARSTESALAWRLGQHVLAQRYARHGELAFRNIGWLPGELLMEALGGASGAPLTHEVSEICAHLEQITWPRLVVQIAGLLFALADEPYRETLRHLVTQRLSEIPAHVYGYRLEVMSVREACALMGLTCA